MGGLDEATANYPAPPSLRKDFFELKSQYSISPFPLFRLDDSTYIEPDGVEALMKNALVEVHFTLTHYNIKSGSGSTDTFSGQFQQFLFLKQGKARSMQGPFGQKRNLRDGPVTINKSFKAVAGTSASTSKKVTSYPPTLIAFQSD